MKKIKNRFKPLLSIPFLISLGILLLNDFYLKEVFHNWLTGKLSDFSGLLVFALFWSAIFPKKKITVYFLTALLFTLWKSPYSQIFIDVFSQHLYPIQRVVDYTDLAALFILPFAYYLKSEPRYFTRLSPVPIAIITVFSFCATSMPAPTQSFERPQYLLFNADSTAFDNTSYNCYCKTHQVDSFTLIEVKEIGIRKLGPIDDDYQKNLILKELDLRFLREANGSRGNLSDYKKLRDSLIVVGETTITLNQDQFTDYLHFTGNRLNGSFKRVSNNNELLMKGHYKNGIEDSVWTVYHDNSGIFSKLYFENGELAKTEEFENSAYQWEFKTDTRKDIIRDKIIYMVIIAIAMIGLVIPLYLNWKRIAKEDIPKTSHFLKISESLIFPAVIIALAKAISSFIPNSFSTFFLEIIGEVILVYAIATPILLLIFYFLKLRGKMDLVYYLLILSLGVVLAEEWFYLKELMQ